MKEVIKYYKNSNSGEVVKTQEFIETSIKNIPVFFYRGGMFLGENLDLKGFIEVKEKTYLKAIK